MPNLSETSKRFGATGTLAAHGAILLACLFLASRTEPTPLPLPVEAMRITLAEPTATLAAEPVRNPPPSSEPEKLREPLPLERIVPAVKKTAKKTAKPPAPKPKTTLPPKNAERPDAPVQAAGRAEPGIKTPNAAAREEARQTVLSALIAHIEREKRYPTAARRLGLEGRIVVIVQVDAQGRIAGVRADGRQAHPVLERATLEALRRVQEKWRPIPVSGPMTLDVPIRYSMRSS